MESSFLVFHQQKYSRKTLRSNKRQTSVLRFVFVRIKVTFVMFLDLCKGLNWLVECGE